MRENARYFVEVSIDFSPSYPDDLTSTRQEMQKKYHMKDIPAIKNLLGGNRVILYGEVNVPEGHSSQVKVI